MMFRDLQRLRTFALVLDLGSVSAAARTLGYTQSSTSQQLQTLEREVGTALVDRSARPLRPTAAGAALRPYVDRLLAAHAAAEAVAGDVRDATARLRLAAFPSALSSFVPLAVRELRRGHPDLVVQVHQLETREGLERLRAGDVDLAVVHHLPGVALPDTSGLERRALLRDELCVVLPEQHRLARREAVRLADLEAEPMVLPAAGTPAGRWRTVVEHLCAQAGFVPRVAYDVDDLPAAQAFAAAGIAVVPMHRLTVSVLPRGAVSRPVEDGGGATRVVEAVVPTGPRAPAATALLEHLTRTAAGWTARDGRRTP